jgi:hypothetical protein
MISFRRQSFIADFAPNEAKISHAKAQRFASAAARP